MGCVSLLGGNFFWDEWNSGNCQIDYEIDFGNWMQSWVNIWLFFNFSLPSPAIVKVLQLLIAIFVLMHSALTVQTIRMICCMLSLPIMLKYFECWSGSKLLITWIAKVLHQWTFFAKSRVHCIDVLAIFIVSGGHSQKKKISISLLSPNNFSNLHNIFRFTFVEIRSFM